MKLRDLAGAGNRAPLLRITTMLLGSCLLAGGAVRPAPAQCNCSTASLVGDQVGTRLNNNPNTVTSVVTSPGIELPNAGPVLGSAGSAPRWNINFESNFIRIDFLQQPATYGAGSKFTFSSLDPKLPGSCPAAHVVGIDVTTNKASAAGIVSTATFTANSVTVPFAGSTNLDWLPGEFILVRFKFGCDTAPPAGDVNPCCPPWSSTKVASVLKYQGTGGIGAPYTLRFQSNPTVDNPLRAYVGYLNAVNPGITSINIQFSLWDAGILGNPSTAPTLIPGTTFTETWTSNSGAVPALPPFFPSGVMQVNHWYTVRTVTTLNNSISFFPDSCARVNISVRLQLQLQKMAPGQPAAVPALQIRTDDGRMLEQGLSAPER